MVRWIWPSLAVLAVAAAVSCTKDNGAYCDETKPCRTGSCDLTARRCVEGGNDLGMPLDGPASIDLAGGDLTMGCAACSGATPLCQADTCVPCTQAPDGEAACAALSATTPHCLADGSCVGCRDATDCSDGTRPACDATSHVCRPCAADSECNSMVCDLTPGSPTLGRCVTPVIYVNKTTGDDANDGLTPQKAVAKISVGVTKAMQAGAPAVRIAAVAGGYYDAENLSLNNATVTLVGETGAAIRPSGTNNPALVTMGNNSKVVVRNLVFTQAVGANGHGIQCSAGQLTVLGCIIHSNLHFGIEANNCGTLIVDRSAIGQASLTTGGNQEGAIKVGNAFRITNNFLVRNGQAINNSGGGIVINTAFGVTPHELIANTIANNVGTGVNAGASCNGGADVVVIDNIFYGNIFGATASETNCPQTYSCTDDATQTANTTDVILTAAPAFVATTDYHLMSASPCRDKGAPSGLPAADIDGQARPDPTSAKSDIGADEFYP